MSYLNICFLCIGILAVIAALQLTGKIHFRIQPLAFIVAIAGLVCFYFAMSNGEIHDLSQRIAQVIVGFVQMFVRVI